MYLCKGYIHYSTKVEFTRFQSQLRLEKIEYPIFYIQVEQYIVGKLGYIPQLLTRYYCNKSCTEGVIFFYLFYRLFSFTEQKILPDTNPKNQQVQNIRTSHTHNTTTHKNKMSCCLPTPSCFALYLHGNICHGPKSWCRDSPQVCCRHLAVGSLSLRLVPLVGMPN